MLGSRGECQEKSPLVWFSCHLINSGRTSGREEFIDIVFTKDLGGSIILYNYFVENGEIVREY